MIASECLWYNENIKIDGETIYYQSPFSENGLNYVGQLFENNHVKTWLQIKHESSLQEKHVCFLSNNPCSSKAMERSIDKQY